MKHVIELVSIEKEKKPWYQVSSVNDAGGLFGLFGPYPRVDICVDIINNLKNRGKK